LAYFYIFYGIYIIKTTKSRAKPLATYNTDSLTVAIDTGIAGKRGKPVAYPWEQAWPILPLPP
jgi:hypothetical protein